MNSKGKTESTAVVFHRSILTWEKSDSKKRRPRPIPLPAADCVSASIIERISAELSEAASLTLSHRRNRAWLIPNLRKSPQMTVCTSVRCRKTFISTYRTKVTCKMFYRTQKQRCRMISATRLHSPQTSDSSNLIIKCIGIFDILL